MNEYSILHLLEGNKKKKFIETKKKRTIKKITKIKKKQKKIQNKEMMK